MKEGFGKGFPESRKRVLTEGNDVEYRKRRLDGEKIGIGARATRKYRTGRQEISSYGRDV